MTTKPAQPHDEGRHGSAPCASSSTAASPKATTAPNGSSRRWPSARRAAPGAARRPYSRQGRAARPRRGPPARARRPCRAPRPPSAGRPARRAGRNRRLQAVSAWSRTAFAVPEQEEQGEQAEAETAPRGAPPRARDCARRRGPGRCRGGAAGRRPPPDGRRSGPTRPGPGGAEGQGGSGTRAPGCPSARRKR